MNLAEKFQWLIDNGFIKVSEPDSHNLYEANVYRSFIEDLSQNTNDNKIESILDSIRSIKSDLDDVEYELENLSEE